MTEQTADHGQPLSRSSLQQERTGGWAAGVVIFAGVMMIMLGVFHALEGLGAILEDQFYVATPNYLYAVDVTAWGWIHLLGGAVVALAGFFVFSGAVWARVVGILLAGLSAIANFLFIPYYPLWSLLMIAVGIFVIWALAVHGRDVAA